MRQKLTRVAVVEVVLSDSSTVGSICNVYRRQLCRQTEN